MDSKSNNRSTMSEVVFDLISKPGPALENILEQQELLLSAARKYDFQQIKSVLELLEKGSPATDIFMQSALHAILSDEFLGHIKEDVMLKCINTLIEHAKSQSSEKSLLLLVNSKTKDRETPLSLAVHYGFERAANILVRCGADTTVRTPQFKGPHALASAIARDMSDLMMFIFDSGVEMLDESKGENQNSVDTNLKLEKANQEANGETLVVSINWRPVLQYCSANENSERRESQGVQKHKYLQKESSFLYSLLDVEPYTRKRYLTHPLVAAFLDLKRRSISRRFKGGQFLLSTFPVFYMIFIYFLYFNRCKMEESPDENLNSTDTAFSNRIKSEVADDGDSKERQRCDITPGISVAAYLLSAFVGGCALFEVYMLLRVDITYMKSWRTWVIRVSIVVMACTLWPALQFNTLYNITWQYPIAAIGTFLAWVMFLIQMELIPEVKVYLEMLVAVVISVLKITLLFMPLLIGFYMGFYLMFFRFGNVMSFILMTVDIGSDEYENMLDNPKDERAWFKAIAFGFSAVFIVIIGIVFINFLLGASINDIQELRQMAKIMTLSNKVQNHFIIDLIFSRRYNVVHVNDLNNISKNELRWIYRPRENDFIGHGPEKRLTSKIKYSLIELLKTKAATDRHENSSLESQKGLNIRLNGLENRINLVVAEMR